MGPFEAIDCFFPFCTATGLLRYIGFQEMLL